MNIKTLTSSHVQRLLELTKKREATATELAHIESQIAVLYGNGESTIPSAAIAAPPAPRRRGPGRPPGKSAQPGAGRRGNLKERIMSLLKTAGSKGLKSTRCCGRNWSEAGRCERVVLHNGQDRSGLKEGRSGNLLF